MELSSRTTCEECAGDTDRRGEDDGCRPERSGRLAATSLELVELVCEVDSSDHRESGIGRSDVVGQASLDHAEEADDDQSKDCPDAKLFSPECICYGEGIEQNEGRGRDEEHPEVVPPVCDMFFDLVRCAREDVEAKVFGEKAVAESVEHV